MKIVFYASGIAGSGRLVRGIAIGNALKRKNIDCEFVILSSSSFAHLADVFGISHLEIPPEDENQLSKENFHESALYKTIIELNADILLVDLLWFNIYNFIHELACKKIFLCHQVFDDFFTIQLPVEKLSFKSEDYDLLFAIEPFSCSFPMDQINPLILRNRDEIFSRNDAIGKLNLDDSRETCLFAFNGRLGDFEKNKGKYSYLEDAGYQMVYTSNYKGGLFPVVDYFNAFDFIICAAGYNQFWEVVYFNKEAVFENVPLAFSSTKHRIKECQEYYFDENGADQLVDIMLSL